MSLAATLSPPAVGRDIPRRHRSLAAPVPVSGFSLSAGGSGSGSTGGSSGAGSRRAVRSSLGLPPFKCAIAARTCTNSAAVPRDVHLLLRRTARVHVPRAAAAASGALQRREADGYSLRIVPSRSGGQQVYLLIEVPEGQTPPRRLVISSPDGTICKEDLPPPAERTIRLLKDADDVLTRTFARPDSELFLS